LKSVVVDDVVHLGLVPGEEIETRADQVQDLLLEKVIHLRVGSGLTRILSLQWKIRILRDVLNAGAPMCSQGSNPRI
jgi:hypothetical protein